MGESIPIRVVVADDWWEWRGSVIHAVSTAADIEVVGEASSAEEALVVVSASQPDVLLVDLNLPEMHGIPLTRVVRARFPQVAVLVFTVSTKTQDVVEALRAGASGYLLKGDTKTPARLAEAIRVAAEGGATLPLRRGREIANAIASREPQDARTRYGLTPRELDVLEHLVGGKPNREIARELGITEQSTKNYVRHILSKCGARNRAELAVRAIREGMVPGIPE
jgi:two-component system, NarL family, nitrate/nitrite response regulator NarL